MVGERIIWGIAIVSLVDIIFEDANYDTWVKYLLLLIPIVMWSTFSTLISSLETALNSLDLTALLGT